MIPVPTDIRKASKMLTLSLSVAAIAALVPLAVAQSPVWGQCKLPVVFFNVVVTDLRT